MPRINRYPCLVFITIISIIGCNADRMLQGVYSPVNKTGPNIFMLRIKPDSTFMFESWSDILGSHISQGKWRTKNTKLYLKEDTLKANNSFIKTIEQSLRVDSLKIKVVDAKDGSAIIGSEIRVNDTSKQFITDANGIVLTPSFAPLKSISFSYTSIYEKIKINNPNSTNITLVVDFDSLPPVKGFVVPTEWLIKKNKLIPLRDNDTSYSLDNAYIRNR